VVKFKRIAKIDPFKTALMKIEFFHTVSLKTVGYEVSLCEYVITL